MAAAAAVPVPAARVVLAAAVAVVRAAKAATLSPGLWPSGEETMREQVLSRLAELIREVVAEDWIAEVDIGDATSFNQDLELESIEFVALAERLQAEFGRKVDFAGWLARKELAEIVQLRVGEVADFIVACLSSSNAA